MAASTPEPPEQLCGIRIGAALDKQFAQCAEGETLFTSAAAPCWQQDRFGGRVVLLPRNSVAEIGAPVRIDRVREWDGVVVEVEIEVPYGDRRRVESYL